MPCKFLVLLFFLSLSACSFFGVETDEPRDAGPQTQVFEGEYDKVWRAAQLALARYPIKINNMDAGHLETDFIKREKIWVPPYQKKQPASGERHQIVLRMVKGISDSNKDAVKVTVTKTVEVLSDFFSGARKQASDGMEERTILYRIDRELRVERALLKANDKDQKKNTKD
jgi:hypothetical protein